VNRKEKRFRKPIKALFITHDTSLYGAQKVLLNILSGIDRNIISALLLTPYDGPLCNKARKLNIPIYKRDMRHWVPRSGLLTKIKRIIYYVKFIIRLPIRCIEIGKLIKNERVDLIYTNTVTVVEPAIVAKFLKIPHIWHIHENILKNSQLTPLFPIKIYTILIGYLSTIVILCSNSLRDNYIKVKNKVRIAKNGISFEDTKNKLVCRNDIICELKINDNSKLIAIVGDLHPRKDHFTFLNAAKIVAEKIENACFLIIGSGTDLYTSNIKEKIKELGLDRNVLMLGWREDVSRILSAADVLVISSEQEPFGLTALEALAMETPVIATKCGGPEEIIEDGVTGLLVEVKNAKAIAEAMVKLLKDKALSRRIALAGKAHVYREYSQEQFLKSIHKIIFEAVKT
jgi:glycosyltransferase involved in cell wall biosynthesis